MFDCIKQALSIEQLTTGSRMRRIALLWQYKGHKKCFVEYQADLVNGAIHHRVQDEAHGVAVVARGMSNV